MLRSLWIALAGCALLAVAPREGYAPVFFVQAPAAGCRQELHDCASFLVNTGGLTAWFSSGEVRIRTERATLGMRFEGANPSPRLEGLDPLPTRVNFLIGEERDWSLNRPAYGRIVYRELYPGIDLVYASDGRNLKSEFVVAPGADPSCIHIRYSGAGRTRISGRGELTIPAGGHELREQAPVIYQRRGAARVAVSGRFAPAADDTVGFAVNDYDRSVPLVIDPVVYSTYLGGGNSDAALAVAVDAAGSAYLAGFTASNNLPTVSAKQPLSAGGNDVFIARMNPAGNGLVYCTYIGGRGDDRAYGIAAGADGSVVVAGTTTSANFPLANPWQPKIAGSKNAFVLKLQPSGTTLSFSTYLGGSGSDTAAGVALDAAGNAYVTGDTTSADFPTTSLQRTNLGSRDAFAAKLSTAGALLYSTYLGGSYDDRAAAIAVDPGGTATITGSTYSADFPVANAMQSASGGGQDAFVARINAAGNALLFSTFLGGNGGALGAPEAGQAVAVDSQGNAYVAGVTSSADFPLVQPLQSSLSGAQDAFVAKVGTAGTLVWSTYLGGSGIDAANAVAVDAAGSVFVAGQSFSTDLPVVDAIQSSGAGDYDAFYAQLAAGGAPLLKLGYLGGRGSDTATAIALDPAGSIYLAGWTLSTDFPIVNAYQSLNSGSYGAFAAKITGGSVPTVRSVTPSSGTGTSQVFAFTFSNAGGAAGLSSVAALFSAAGGTANACAVTYDPAGNTLLLLDNAGAPTGSGIAPGSGSLQNSQCILNGSASSVSISGSLLTLNLALTFQSAFTGTQTVYAQVASPAGSTGWQEAGSWTVPQALPLAVSVTPSSGSGTSQVFTFAFSDGSGYTAISSVSILVNSSLAQAGGCYVLYNRSANMLYLSNDAATAWLSPIAPGGSGSVQNSQCTLQASASFASGSGNDLTVRLSLQFRLSFTGSKNVYMEAYDGKDSGWQQRGVWTIPSNAPPAPVSVTPSSGTVSSQTVVFTFSDSKGYTAISSVSALVNGSLTNVGGCYVLYYRASNVLYLANDAATAWQSPIVLGSSASTQNSQCTVQASGSSASGSGDVLTLNLAISFQTGFAGAKNVYLEAYDGLDSGWVQKGSWTIPGAAVFGPISVTPSSGTGVSQSFSFTYSDPRGYMAIQSTSMLINSSMTGGNGCYLLHYRASNVLYLANNASTAWLPPITLGGSATVENSQCRVSAAASSASGSGTSFTVTLSITFLGAFHGTRNVYMEVYDGTDSGWSQKGTWTIP